jgi:hypothetical protein
MAFCHPRLLFVTVSLLALAMCAFEATACAQDSSSSSASRTRASKKVRPAVPSLDDGSVSGGAYRNSSFGFTCKIPAGWVLRTEEMNTRDNEDGSGHPATDSGKAGRVLLAAFSRPPEARAEDVNASILIAAEDAAEYPGLKEPAQYFGPVIEAAKAQGLEIDDEPYEFVLGTKKLVRGDFQKDVGARVLRQSTLVMLTHGYLVSFTFIGGTEDEVEELIDGLKFVSGPRAK